MKKAIIAALFLTAGNPRLSLHREIPSLEYARKIQSEANGPESSNPNLKYVGASADYHPPQVANHSSDRNSVKMQQVMARQGAIDFRSPNESPSLWRPGRSQAGLFKDFRAWKPMDLLTIVVQEVTEGRKEADTNVLTNSVFQGAISRLLGLEDTLASRNTQVVPTALLDATANSLYQGEGETIRRGSLTGTISAMVVEVLPSGILRVEGKKIISVNNEEQTMVISGLVRSRDINSDNEVDSSKIANMRIDYFGSGLVSEAQSPGWLGRIFLKLWPF